MCNMCRHRFEIFIHPIRVSSAEQWKPCWWHHDIIIFYILFFLLFLTFHSLSLCFSFLPFSFFSVRATCLYVISVNGWRFMSDGFPAQMDRSCEFTLCRNALYMRERHRGKRGGKGERIKDNNPSCRGLMEQKKERREWMTKTTVNEHTWLIFRAMRRMWEKITFLRSYQRNEIFITQFSW